MLGIPYISAVDPTMKSESSLDIVRLPGRSHRKEKCEGTPKVGSAPDSSAMAYAPATTRTMKMAIALSESLVDQI